MGSVGRRLAGFAWRVSQIPWRRLGSDAGSNAAVVAKILCGIHVINSYAFSTCTVMGPSMLPTLSLTGDIVGVNKFVTWRGSVEKGDVVLLISPENPRKLVAKRVLGMEGDSVTYLVDPGNSDEKKTIEVPKGHVWVQGDNIYASRDSRKFGTVPLNLIQGKIFCTIWPPENFGLINSKVKKDYEE